MIEARLRELWEQLEKSKHWVQSDRECALYDAAENVYYAFQKMITAKVRINEFCEITPIIPRDGMLYSEYADKLADLRDPFRETQGTLYFSPEVKSE